MPPVIQVNDLQVTPNDCPLENPLTVDMSFTSDQPLQQVFWEVQYMVDMTVQRHILQLGSTEQQAYAAGKSSLHLALPTIDIGGLKKSWLNNVGLLLVFLKDTSGKQILQVSMVSQIEIQDGKAIRHMLSPLE